VKLKTLPKSLRLIVQDGKAAGLFAGCSAGLGLDRRMVRDESATSSKGENMRERERIQFVAEVLRDAENI
jgi:hypothetical protein